MAINIKNDYPEFVITDTLHQLVDRLNHLTDLVDSNTRLFDSSVNTILNLIDSDGDGIINDSNLVINSLAGSINMSADSELSFSAGDNLTLSAAKTVTIDAGEKLLFNTDSGEILLRSQGTQFGALKKDPAANELEIWTGNDLVLSFDATLNTTVAGSITMPSSGSTPNTNSKTVHGAINEVIQEHDSDQAVTDGRLDTLEPEVASLRTDLTALDARTDLLDSFATSQNLLNIADRLTTIEAQIVQINDRLNILEIFA
jgi:hypothetical protein